MRIFQLFDADQDGSLNFEEFIRAVESFGRLYTSEDKCMCESHTHLLEAEYLLHAASPCTLHGLLPNVCMHL